MKKILSIVFSLFLSFSLMACNDNNIPSNPIDLSDIMPEESSELSLSEEYEINSDNKDEIVHYLSFEIEGMEVAKIVVLPTDTYDTLKPYFPTIPEKEGYEGYWEKIDNVYSEDSSVVVIVAYYRKKS